MKRFVCTALLACVLLGCAAAPVHAAPPGKRIAVYHIGNSLTRNLSVRRLASLFKASGGHYDHGTQLSGGKPLYAHLANRTANGREFKRNNIESKKYGDWLDAFAKHKFDAIVLQASGTWLTDRDPDNKIVTGEVEAVAGFIKYASGDNPANNVATERFYIYGTWPGYPEMLKRTDLDADKNGVVSFSEFWEAPYKQTGEWARLQLPNRDFQTKLIAAVNAQHPQLKHPVRLVPAGDVFNALDKKIRAGQMPGLRAYMTRKTKLIVKGQERPSNFEYYRTQRHGKPNARRRHLAGLPLDPDADDYTGYVQSEGIRNVYADRGHMNAVPHNGDDDGTLGGYIASLTFYATFTGTSPVGVTYKPWERIDPVADAALVKAVQKTVWEVVSTHPLAGVAKPPTKPSAAE